MKRVGLKARASSREKRRSAMPALSGRGSKVSTLNGCGITFLLANRSAMSAWRRYRVEAERSPALRGGYYTTTKWGAMRPAFLPAFRYRIYSFSAYFTQRAGEHHPSPAAHNQWAPALP